MAVARKKKKVGRPKGRAFGKAVQVRLSQAQVGYLEDLSTRYLTTAEAIRACIDRCIQIDQPKISPK